MSGNNTVTLDDLQGGGTPTADDKANLDTGGNQNAPEPESFWDSFDWNSILSFLPKGAGAANKIATGGGSANPDLTKGEQVGSGFGTILGSATLPLIGVPPTIGAGIGAKVGKIVGRFFRLGGNQREGTDAQGWLLNPRPDLPTPLYAPWGNTGYFAKVLPWGDYKSSYSDADQALYRGFGLDIVDATDKSLTGGKGIQDSILFIQARPNGTFLFVTNPPPWYNDNAKPKLYEFKPNKTAPRFSQLTQIGDATEEKLKELNFVDFGGFLMKGDPNAGTNTPGAAAITAGRNLLSQWWFWVIIVAIILIVIYLKRRG